MSLNYLRSFLFRVVVGVFGITTLNADITLRARVISIEPEKTYVRLLYSMGQSWEELTREKPRPPTIEETRADFGRDQTRVEPDVDLGLRLKGQTPT